MSRRRTNAVEARPLEAQNAKAGEALAGSSSIRVGRQLGLFNSNGDTIGFSTRRVVLDAVDGPSVALACAGSQKNQPCAADGSRSNLIPHFFVIDAC